MTKMEFNKEGLFLLAKKLTNQNYSLPKNMSLKSNQIQSKRYYHNSYRNEINNSSSKDFLINESEENINPPSKRGLKFKNKFLEKDNIQINEEKMLNLLSERKRKMKLTLSHGNKKMKKLLGKNKIIYINLDKTDNNKSNIINVSNTKVNSQHDSNFKFKKIVKYNTQFEKHNIYNDINPYSNKVLYTSNSEVFNNNFISDRKSMKIIGKNINLNLINSYRTNNSSNLNPRIINYSRNEENNINESIVNQLYSIKRSNSPNIDEINEENIDNEIYNDNSNLNNIKNNNINNNININININNNINNNNDGINHIKSIENNNKVKKSKTKLNRIYQPNKYLSYIRKPKKISNAYLNNVESLSFSGDNKIKDINNTSEKVIKKYISQKIYYLKDNDKDDKLNRNKYFDEEIEEGNNNNDFYKYIDEKNKREKGLEKNERKSIKYKDYNTYNINVNFISDKNNEISTNNRNIINNIKFFNSFNSTLIPMSPNSMLSQKKEVRGSKNVIFYKSLDDNNQIYSSEIVTKRHIENDNKNNLGKKLEYTKKSIRKKIYKNKPLTDISKSNSKTKIIIYNNKNKIDNSNQIKQNNNINNKKDIIHLEDLLILEGKFCHLLECLRFENPVPKICVEWWNFYTYCSFFGKFPKLFPKEKKEEENNSNNDYLASDYQLAHDAVIFELLSMIIIYKILCDDKASKNLINNLKKLINEVHQNFLIECDYILSRVNCKSINNIWIQKLKNLILEKKNWKESYSEKNDFHLNLLKQGNNSIQNIIQNIIDQYLNLSSNNIDVNSIIYFNKNISKIHLKELSGYFNKAINQENIKINRTFSYMINNNINNKKKYLSIVVPYLPEKIENKKNYTLVLDLDETLISFKFNEQHIGMLKMRPGLYNFLENVKKKYELVIFTAGTQEYADPILDKIEKNGKIFAKRLYRQHATLMNNIYLKDLTRLGRDLSKIIIVDNMPQNFSLQKENGILIKNYFGQDKYDTTLNDLTPILLKIASKPNNDVREELKKYREEIFTKITTNLRC